MREQLQLHLDREQYRRLAERYHFRDTDLELLMRIGKMTEQAAQPVMYCGTIGKGERIEPGERMAVIVSLGEGVDALQESYMRRECLTEGYMIECISMELLQTAYEKTAQRIHERTGMWMEGMEFPGDRAPIGDLEEIWRLLNPLEISYNQAYMMSPKKTAAFYVNLCAVRQDGGCHVCVNCGNLSCASRDGMA